MATIWRELTINGKELEIEFEGSVKVVNGGIGSYEYWGAKCHDYRPEPEVEDIWWDEKLYTAEENAFIKDYLDSNSDEVAESIIENANESD